MRFAMLARGLIVSLQTLQSLCTPKENKNNYQYSFRRSVYVLTV